MTSELRELLCAPIASSASRMITSRPAVASARATARPTTPAPMTTDSTLSKLGCDCNGCAKQFRPLAVLDRPRRDLHRHRCPPAGWLDRHPQAAVRKSRALPRCGPRRDPKDL